MSKQSKKYAKAMRKAGYKVRDLKLGEFKPADLRGLPFIGEGDGITDPDILKTIYNLITDRKVSDFILKHEQMHEDRSKPAPETVVAREHFPADERQQVDAFHWHEALDRAHIMVEQFDALLLTHPVLEKDVALRQAAQEIADRLAALYETIGTRETGPTEPTEPIDAKPKPGKTYTIHLNPADFSRVSQSLYFHTNFVTNNTPAPSADDKAWEAGQRAVIDYLNSLKAV